ncbi:ATP-dependent microtubule motor [Aureococcus anophagefferens]|nr:ATP-dependent microtubule motor [Aureococcus anophagefferens]
METVSVFARVRPLSAREAREGEGRAVYAQAAHGAVSVASAYGGDGDRAFRFERVFDEDASQGDVFAACCAPLRARADRTSDGERGLIPRAMACLFGALKRSRARACVKVSYVEIHNERVVDLLRPPDGDGEPAALDIRDDAERGMIALGAEEVEVGAEDQVLDVLWFGAENRAMCATDLNGGARGRTIFAVAIERLDRDGRLLRSKLNLVDLAGSEKWRSYELKAFSAARCAARIKELTSINQSLSALANVVGALIAGKAHVPYRASKLTRLLQDSLGGTCKAAFVATMSPCASAAGRETQIFNPTSMSAVEETLSTLHFARRAMKSEELATATAPRRERRRRGSATTRARPAARARGARRRGAQGDDGDAAPSAAAKTAAKVPSRPAAKPRRRGARARVSNRRRARARARREARAVIDEDASPCSGPSASTRRRSTPRPRRRRERRERRRPAAAAEENRAANAAPAKKKKRPVVARHLDAATGVYYYYDRKTKETTWSRRRTGTRRTGRKAAA